MVQVVATIRELESQIRDFINSRRKQHALLGDPASWDELCSSLDVIGDTELAFAAYDRLPEPKDDGAAYILVYGFLQALVVQQDAVRHLCEALDISYSLDPRLVKIRGIRHDAIGHPTKQGEGKGTRFSFISRPTIGKWGFQLMTATPGKWPPVFRDVNLRELLESQREMVKLGLVSVVEALRREEMEHREQFKNKKLASVFPATLHYYFEKLYESTRGSKGWEFGRLHVGLVAKVVSDFRDGLRERGVLGTYDTVEYHLQLVDYPLEQLAQYFESGGTGKLNERDAFVFITFVESQMDELRKMAVEIDATYQSEV